MVLFRRRNRNTIRHIASQFYCKSTGLGPELFIYRSNTLSFLTYRITQDVATSTVLELFPGSRTGDFLLTSMTIAAVPEPDTGMLALAGVAALGVVLRGRSRRQLKGSGLKTVRIRQKS